MCVGSGSRLILSMRFNTFEHLADVIWSRRNVGDSLRTSHDGYRE